MSDQNLADIKDLVASDLDDQQLKQLQDYLNQLSQSQKEDSTEDVAVNEKAKNQSGLVAVWFDADKQSQNTLNIASRRILTLEVILGHIKDPNNHNQPRKETDKIRLKSGINFGVNWFLFEKAREQHQEILEFEQKGILKVFYPEVETFAGEIKGYSEADIKWIVENTQDVGLLEEWQSQVNSAQLQGVINQKLRRSRGEL